ncbi:MAG: hypothetical protein ABFS35_10955 [Bacteroidota bacterium]
MALITWNNSLSVSINSIDEEHEYFIEKVDEVEKRFNEGKFILSLELITFFKDWLQTHIMLSDKKYSEFLIAKGVK